MNNALILLSLLLTSIGTAQQEPLKIGVVGLTHTHVHWIFESAKKGTIEIVGIAEPNRELAQRYSEQYGFSMSLVYDSMDQLLEAKKPQAVCAFGTIFEHLEVVQKAAPRGIHVMVEKPLAVNLEHALQMEALSKKHDILLLTNYETTWYPSTHQAYDMVQQNSIGALSKIVVRDGHRGPKKIGVNSEFLEWLTDPVQNGGGAITDFGCYGINLATWLLQGEKPLEVTAVTQQLQPENNPKVDDESTIILAYKNKNAIIQASWNWPIGRKDMELYGSTGTIYADNKTQLRMRTAVGYDGFDEQKWQLQERTAPYDDPFSFFAGVINKQISLKPFDLSSLENNMMVMRVLDAAIRSAKQKKTITLKQ